MVASQQKNTFTTTLPHDPHPFKGLLQARTAVQAKHQSRFHVISYRKKAPGCSKVLTATTSSSSSRTLSHHQPAYPTDTAPLDHGQSCGSVKQITYFHVMQAA
jgi:hypothetical protein